MYKFLSFIIFVIFFLPVLSYADDTSTAFTLNTTGFLDQGVLPVLYTCDGKNVPPEFDWSNVPAKTQTLALILTDPDAPGGVFYHWVVYNIPKTGVTFPNEMEKAPANVMVGKNSFGKEGYSGPCPPKGASHSYIFTLYALDTKLSVPAGTDGKTVLKAMQGHIVNKTILTAIYSRWLK